MFGRSVTEKSSTDVAAPLRWTWQTRSMDKFVMHPPE